MKRIFGMLLVMVLLVGCGAQEDIEPYIVRNENGAVTGFTGYSETDADLEQLTEMPELESVVLSGCENITNSGVAELQKALPNCEIIR